MKKTDQFLASLSRRLHRDDVRQCLALAAIVFSGWILFAPCLNNFFMLDNIDLLDACFRQNNLLVCFHPLFVMPFRLRPLEGLQFLAGYHLFGLDPRGYLLVTMFSFLSASVILYFIFKTVFNGSIALGFLACLLTVVHPLHIEEFGADIPAYLYFLVFVSALLCYLFSLRQGPGTGYFYMLSLVLYSAGIFVREDILIFPLFVLLYHLLLEGLPGIIKAGRRIASFFIVLAAYFIIRFPLLKLWISSQADYRYDFLDLKGVLYNSKVFTGLAFKLFANPLNFILPRNWYIGNLSVAAEAAGYAFILAILLFWVFHGGIGSTGSNTRPRLFLLGIFWYAAGLLPYLFIQDELHFNIHYLLIPMIGLALSVSVAISAIHQNFFSDSRYFTNALLVILFIVLFGSTFLLCRHAVVMKRPSNYSCDYFRYASLGDLTRKCILAIKRYDDRFPIGSQVYLIGFPPKLRIPAAVPIFYHDKSLKVYGVTAERRKEIKPGPDKGVFIFKFGGKDGVIDLTAREATRP